MAAWTHDENKLFKKGIAVFDHESPPDLFESIRELVPNKTTQDIQQHYQELARDFQMIEFGVYDPTLPPMIYIDRNIPIMDQHVEIKEKKIRRWTDEEHRLKTFRKKDWRRIARDCVPTKTAQQVTSHAQKHFIKIEKQQQNQQHQMQYQQQEESSSSYSQNVCVVTNSNEAETSRAPAVDATMVTRDSSGPGCSDIAHD